MPPRHRLLKICAMLLLAAAAPPPLVLSAPPPLAPQLAAFPRIAAPLTPQTIRINAALDAADQRARAAAAQCRDDAAPQPWSFSRTVTVAMRGPKFLAFTAADETDCGGAHPNAGIFALVYDLSTGAPINWARYLPKSLIDGTTTEPADDNTNIGEINSTILTPIFLREFGDTNDCADALPSQTNGFILWPDTADHGLDIYDPDIPFVYGPCAGPVTILLPELRKLGVKPPLLTAIDATASPP